MPGWGRFAGGKALGMWLDAKGNGGQSWRVRRSGWVLIGKRAHKGREASGQQRGWQSHTTMPTTQSPATDQEASAPGRRVATCPFTPLPMLCHLVEPEAQRPGPHPHTHGWACKMGQLLKQSPRDPAFLLRGAQVKRDIH